MAIGQNPQQENSQAPKTGTNQAGRSPDREIGDKKDKQDSSQNSVNPEMGDKNSTRQAAGQVPQQKPASTDKKISSEDEDMDDEKSDEKTSSTRSNQSGSSPKENSF